MKQIWKWIRGIHKAEYWHMPCRSCGFSGRVHYTGMFFPCIRFEPTKKVSKK